MSQNLAFSLSPRPASTIIVRAPRMTSGRIASVMRLRGVGGRLLFPERLGHDAEHRAAVETDEPVADRNELEVAKRVIAS